MRMKDVDFKILAGLMKNSKISDRKLADLIGVSQPTITRRRARLEAELSLDYTVIPDFSKLGIEIMAFHFSNWKAEEYDSLSKTSDFQKRIAEFIKGQNNMILISSGQGCGQSRVGVSFHRDYSEYVAYRAKVQEEWGAHLANYESFIISLKSDRILRPLTLKYLADYIQNGRST